MFLLFRVFALIQDAAYLKDEKLVFVINTLTLSLKKQIQIYDLPLTV